MSVEMLRSGLLAPMRHGFLGRAGGVSKGVCAGLNVGFGSKDDEAAILENRRRAVDAVAPGAELVTLHQIHSAEAAVATAVWARDQRPHADGLATDRPGLALAILTADCAPVLLADAGAGVIGAAHAGWRGAQGGIVEATIVAMERLGAERSRIAAAVGPCIAQASYEVGEDVSARFAEADRAAYFTPACAGHFRFDLAGFVLSRLAAAGLSNIEKQSEDTYAQPDRFFSFRRATHQGEPDYGRQVSMIALPG